MFHMLLRVVELLPVEQRTNFEVFTAADCNTLDSDVVVRRRDTLKKGQKRRRGGVPLGAPRPSMWRNVIRPLLKS